MNRIEILFGKNLTKILRFFFRHPNQTFYQDEIKFKNRLSHGTTRYELKKLVKARVLNIIPTSYKTFYSLNKKSTLYKHLSKIIKH